MEVSITMSANATRLTPRRDGDYEDLAASEDPVRSYLQEVGRVTLLTAQDEQRLGRVLEDSRYVGALIAAYRDDIDRLVAERRLGEADGMQEARMVREGEKPRREEASCCRLEVVKGG